MSVCDEVCRTCLMVSRGEEPFLSINFINFPQCVTIRSKLKSCIPEMILPDVEQAYICNPCAKLLDVAYVFRGMCLKTEERLSKLAPMYYADIVRLEKSEKGVNGFKRPQSESNFIRNENSAADIKHKKEKDVNLGNINSSSKTVVEDVIVNEQNTVNVIVDKSKCDEVTTNEIIVTPEIKNEAIISDPFENAELNNDVVETIVEVHQNSILEDSLIVIDDDEDFGNNISISKLAISEDLSNKGDKKLLTEEKILLNACQTIPELQFYEPEMLQCTIVLDKLTEEELIENYESKLKDQLRPKSPAEDELQVISKVEVNIDQDHSNTSNIRKRKRTHKGDLICNFCGHDFVRRDKLICHVRRVHTKEKPFVCKYCKKRFFENWILKQHVKTHHFDLYIQDETMRTRKRQNLINILDEINVAPSDNVKPIPPSVVNVKSEPTNDIPSNTINVKSKPNNKITLSTVNVKGEPSNKNPFRAVHVKSEPSSKIVPSADDVNKEPSNINKNNQCNWHKCIICKKSFGTAALLQKHSIEHKTIKCEECKDTFTSHQTFNAHIDRGCVKKYQCKICSRKFSSISVRNVHVKEHETTETGCYFCKDCNITVHSQDHFNVHTGLRPYKCKVCGKDFASSTALNGHMQMHGRHRYFKCPQCNRNFIKKTHLEKHIQEHKKFNFKCNVCKRPFPNEIALNSHTCVNAKGECIYKCQVCKNDFIGRAALIEHVKVHFTSN